MKLGSTVTQALGALITAVAFFAIPAMAAEQKPKVVFILADSVGYGDLGPYGGGEAVARRARKPQHGR